MKLKSWKTTSTGLLLIIGGISTLVFTQPLSQSVVMAAATGIIGGIGLIFAKDSNVTGGNM